MNYRISKLRSSIMRCAYSALAVLLLTGAASPIAAFADDSSSSAQPASSTTAPAPANSSKSDASTTPPAQSTPANTTSPSASTSTTNAPAAATPAVTPDTTPAATPAINTGPTTQTGPKSPAGADAKTYTYNANSGLWENQYYTWNPVTGQTTPRTTPTYSYNPATGMWDTTQYKYDAPSGTYVPNVVAVAKPPASATKVVPNATTSMGGSNNGLGNSGALLSSSNNGTFDNFYNAGISNKLSSVAVTGDATIYGNTTGGSALSGNATTSANILNMLQSSANLLGNNAQTFVSNIYGDVQGDILINPTNMSQPATDATTGTNNNFKLNSQNSGQINNDINVASTSGNATVSKNTSGGDATTGNASAIANVVNVLDSMISAKQSFLGVVNIYGNLTGNIVMPQEFLDQLLATNAPTATIDASAINNYSSTVNNSQSINNNVDNSAVSGSADVSHNTTAGSATTGSASNKVTVFNLTGSQYISADTMLVFVNVMGQWIGVMMNAPVGSTAAAYGSGVTSTTTVANNTNVNVANNQSINNNIHAKANSGNAAVTDNTKGGNAKSGSADTAVNLLNLTNDQFSASHWFGILFINVFGNWYGNLGVSKPVVASTTGGSNTVAGSTDTGMKVFQFVPKSSSTGNSTGTQTSGGTHDTSSTAIPGAFQLVSAKLAKEAKVAIVKQVATTSGAKQGVEVIQIIGAAVFIGGLGMFGIEHYMKARARGNSL
jgi:hypothetical protein